MEPMDFDDMEQVTSSINYPGFLNYFTEDQIILSEFRSKLTQCRKLVDKLVVFEGKQLDCIENCGFFSLNVQDIKQADPTLLSKLLDDPLTITKYLCLAVNCAHREFKEKNAQEDKTELRDKSPRFWLDLTGHQILTPIGDIQPPHYNKFITIVGTVVSIGPIHEVIYEAGFRCETCSAELFVFQPMGKFQSPKSCPSAKCTPSNSEHRPSKISFTRINSTIKVPSQMIKIIQTRFDPKTDEKRVDSINVQLLNHLIESCFIMDSVTVSGTIVEPKTIEGEGICGFYMIASSMQKNTEEEFPPSILAGIKAIIEEPDVLGLLVGSLCPSVSGNDMAKLGVLLSLVGGHDSPEADEAKEEDDSLTFRGQCHVLLLGGPNVEKREILKAAHRMAPISVYVDSSYKSNLVYEISSESGEATLNAGPVLQANKGTCCVDDLDMMKTQWNFVSEIMETQTFRVAKNTFIHTLPVDITVISSATPASGSYCREKTLYENIRMPGEMLNQFDLIFNLVDVPDHQADLTYTKKILGNHRGRHQLSKTGLTQESPTGSSPSLFKRLTTIDKESMDLLPRSLLSKYLDYARRKIFPVFDDDCTELLSAFKEEFQEKSYRATSPQISNPTEDQVWKSLIRLCIARARLELKDKIEKQDALDVIELIKHTRFDIFPRDVLSSLNSQVLPSFKRTDYSQSSNTGVAVKRCRSSNERFIQYLHDYFSENRHDDLTHEELMAIARNGPHVAKLEQLLNLLNDKGYILQKGPNKYRWVR